MKAARFLAAVVIGAACLAVFPLLLALAVLYAAAAILATLGAALDVVDIRNVTQRDSQ